MKNRTNRQVLTQLIKNADEMQLVFIRERLLSICDVFSNSEEVKKNWSNDFISPDFYIEAAKKTKEAIDF